MKYLIIVFCALTLNGFGQNYKAVIAKYRDNYQADFLKDPSSPLKSKDLQYLRFYDADSTYRVTATVTLYAEHPAFIMPVFSGTGRQYERYALLKFVLKGKPMELTIYKSLSLSNNPVYHDYLFLPFTDETNGSSTYGGGRYIDMTEKDIKNGNVEIDFNKAYNPYCAFSAGYMCPKPPGENRIAMAVEAGEKLFAGPNGH